MPKLYIETVGCQMNELDSELVVASLRKDGYELTASPHDADTILFNTCSVRQHAEDKIYSALGRLKNAKREHPGKVIGVLGCMAQKDQGLIFKRAPYVDLIVGPGQLHQVPALVRELRAEGDARTQRMEVSLGRKDGTREQIERSHESFDPLRDPAMRPTPYQAYVRIMIGCDKFCTYCIVPSVRGPEQSRPPQQILAESRQLASEGCKEIILLGQTVNSYKYREGDRTWRLSDLLAALHDVDGIERIKFVTNYPKDMTNDLLAAVRDLPKVSKYLHVPVQSGSNDVLSRMKRGYTVEDYREMIVRTKEWIPGVAVSSDFIVGFCGETDDEFQLTMDLVRESPLQKQLHLQIQRTPRHQGRRVVPGRCPRRSQTPPQPRAARPPKRNQRSRQPRLHRPASRDPGRRPQQSRRKASCRRGSRGPSPQPAHSNSPAAPIATESSSSKATPAKLATPCRSSSTTPTPIRSSAKSPPGTAVPSYSRSPFHCKRPE